MAEQLLDVPLTDWQQLLARQVMDPEPNDFRRYYLNSWTR